MTRRIFRFPVRPRLTLASATLAGVMLTSAVLAPSVQAQTNEPPTQPAAQPFPGGVPGAMPGATIGAMPSADWGKMTPEERRAALEKIISDSVRGAMTHMGFSDQATQDAVVESALEQERALDEVREAHRKVTWIIMTDPHNERSIAALMNELRAKTDEANEIRQNSIDHLAKRIDLNSKPRLEALLSLIGITGDESSQLTGIAGSVMGAMANFTRQLG